VGKSSDTFDEQEWVESQRDQCLSVIGEIWEAMEALRQLPETEREAVQMVALEGIEALLPTVSSLAPPGMTRDQCVAAMMLGRGLTSSEVAESLEIENAQACVLHWMTQRPFRRLVQHWRHVTMHDQFGKVMRDLDRLSASNLRADVALKVARLRWEISQAPGGRELAEAQLGLKAKQVALQENVVQGRGAYQRPTWREQDASRAEIVDADFEPVPGLDEPKDL
jgi:hypothetical protein